MKCKACEYTDEETSYDNPFADTRGFKLMIVKGYINSAIGLDDEEMYLYICPECQTVRCDE